MHREACLQSDKAEVDGRSHTSCGVCEFWKGRAAAFIRIAAFVFAWLGFGGVIAAQAQQAGDKIVLREAFPSKGSAFWINYVARTQGFYAQEGLEVQPVLTDPNVTVASLIGGSVNVAFADSTQLLLALERGAELVAFSLSTDRQPYRLMAAASIRTVADLKGKKIGATSRIDVYTNVIREILREGGLDPEKDVVWFFGSNQNQRAAAIEGGAIDAGLFSSPNDARLASRGFNGLAFTPDYYPYLTLSAEAVRRDWAEKNADTVRKFVRAHDAAVKWINDPANRAQATAILMKEMNVAQADAEAAYDYFIGTKVWRDGCIHAEGLVNVVKMMRETQQLKSIDEAHISKLADAQWCSK